MVEVGTSNNNNEQRVAVHPVVLFSILDHYMRRSEGQGRVIGALLGTRVGKKVDITNCFPVPHVEKGEEEVAVGKEHMRQMLNLHLRVNDGEDIIGWYATSDGGILINEQSCLIHDFFTAECPDPFHLVVDTSLQDNMLGVKAFISSPLILGDRALAAAFKQIKVDIDATGAEKIGLDMMIKSPVALGDAQPLNSSMDDLEDTLESLLEMLGKVASYVSEVINGNVQPDYTIGSKIANVVSMVPRIKPEFFAKSFNNTLHDLLMVVYLSNLTRTQLAIAERLGVMST
mmetsp:Transcript_20698/g.25096  ORF Transcript_20698/g.25096 Transcript_20698/m.25096 type:complete len:287 (+) Transcript_20698:356-1216(+)